MKLGIPTSGISFSGGHEEPAYELDLQGAQSLTVCIGVSGQPLPRIRLQIPRAKLVRVW